MPCANTLHPRSLVQITPVVTLPQRLTSTYDPQICTPQYFPLNFVSPCKFTNEIKAFSNNKKFHSFIKISSTHSLNLIWAPIPFLTPSRAVRHFSDASSLLRQCVTFVIMTREWSPILLPIVTFVTPWKPHRLACSLAFPSLPFDGQAFRYSRILFQLFYWARSLVQL
jgi:hypothetical protein